MKQMNRSGFFGAVNNELDANDMPVNSQFKEFYNKTLPQFSSRSSSGLGKYAGTFGKSELSHLLRRTLFGVTKADLDHFAGKTLDEVVAALLIAAPAPPEPVNAYNNPNFTDPDVPAGSSWVNAPLDTNGTANAKRRISLKQWWVGLMLNQDRSITEKMTLFWHNHFATEISIIGDARYAYKHHALLRANALGNFKTLARLVTTDPGMLIYLNGDTNTKGAPNENYGRELQELFTVGKGPDSHYTQSDVEAAARVLTGWKHKRTVLPISSYFDDTKHDTGDKQFSSFYNNTVIVGQPGANGANETDQLIDMLFAQTETAKFFCRKLYRFFIYYVIDQQVEDDIITPLASLMVSNNYDIKPVLTALLSSEHFFDSLNVGCHIKNPADHVIGICRQFNITFPDATNQTDQYTGWGIIVTLLASLTLDPGDPPNVAGWPAYYQEPAFHELWINSNTLPLRNQFSDILNSTTGYKYRTIILQADVIAFAQQFTNPGDPNALIADSAALLSPNDIGATQSSFLKSILLSGQDSDHYWSDAWTQYINNPTNNTFKNTVLTRLRSMYAYMMGLAEYQLI